MEGAYLQSLGKPYAPPSAEVEAFKRNMLDFQGRKEALFEQIHPGRDYAKVILLRESDRKAANRHRVHVPSDLKLDPILPAVKRQYSQLRVEATLSQFVPKGDMPLSPDLAGRVRTETTAPAA